MRRPGVRLAYRRHYRDKTPLEQAIDRTLASFLHGYEENPLDVAVEIAPASPLPVGRFLVEARLLVPLFRLATLTRGDFHEAKLRLLVISGQPGRASSGVRQVEVPLRVPRAAALIAFGQKYAYDVGLELGPGDHVVAFAVRDELGGKTSYLRRQIAIPAAAAPPAIR